MKPAVETPRGTRMTSFPTIVQTCDQGAHCAPICADAEEAGEWPTLGVVLRACEELGINPFRFLAAHEPQLAREALRKAR